MVNPRELAGDKGHREAQGPLPLCLTAVKPWVTPSLIGCGAAAGLVHPSTLSPWMAPAPQNSVGGGNSLWLPGWAARSCRGSSAHRCHAVPAHKHWRSLAAPALSRSKATPCPHGVEGQRGGGAGGITAKRTAGHSQLGTGTQMVLPESCSSDQRVMDQERGLLGEEQSR